MEECKCTHFVELVYPLLAGRETMQSTRLLGLKSVCS